MIPAVMMRRAAVVAIACVVVAPPRAADRRPIQETDLLRFTWAADPQIAPDGRTVAFVRVVVNAKQDGYDTSVFAVAAGGGAEPRRLTAGDRDTAPRWSPDGRRLAFLRAPERDGKRQPAQIYVLDMSGGEARAVTDLPKAAGAPVWSPDGRTIAFTSTTTASDLREAQEGRKGQTARAGTDAHADEAKSHVRVITRAVYRENGTADFLDSSRHSHIWTVAVTDGAGAADPKPVTSGEFNEEGLAWSRDGAQIYFTSTRIREEYFEPSHSELYSVPAVGGPIASIAKIDGTVDEFSVAPDGGRIAFIGTLNGTPVRSYSQPDLWVTDARPDSRPRNLTEGYDFDIGGGIGGDQGAPRGGHQTPIVWSQDGRSLLVVAAERGSANLKRVDVAAGTLEPLTDMPATIQSYSATAGAAAIAAVISTPTAIGDVFVIDRGPERAAPQPADRRRAQPTERSAGLSGPRQITHLNDGLFSGIAQSQPEEFQYASFDGRRIEGWILKPADFDASKKYPMILEIHGGPHSAYGNVFTHEFMWLAAKGYVVLYTNPRGSSNYGQEFGNVIQFHYPGDDYRDLMAGVDEVVRRGYVDPARLGVTGGSGGGLLTNWTITQTQRFKAAVAQRDIADWAGFWYTADFAQFVPFWFRKAPWQDPQEFAARSPLTYVDRVTTPLMLLLGDQDYRTPPASGGEMMFRALKFRKIPTVMVRFPRENHELSRSGEPTHRIERLRHIAGWMDEWLMGRKNDVYSTSH